MNNEIRIRPFAVKFIFWGTLYLICVVYVVSQALALIGIIDSKFYDEETNDFFVFVYFFFFPFIFYWILRNEGQYSITEKTISAHFLFKRKRCTIYLDRPVYYSIIKRTSDRTKCIMISNYEFVADAETQNISSVDTIIVIPYYKKVRAVIPKDNWIEVTSV